MFFIDLLALVTTGLQLIQDISAYQVDPDLLAQLQGLVKTTLESKYKVKEGEGACIM
jgi:sensor domain CHASE-containing protein